MGDLIGSGASEEAAVIGETPNLAARLQGLAEPNQLVLSRETSNLLGKIFALKSLGSSELKGIAAPVSVFAVTGLAPLQSRFDAQQTGTLAPLHGRDTELNQIQEQWVRAQSGDGQLVLITGEAGIGKSRLTRAMVESVTDDDHNFVVCQCSPYHMDSALHPVIAQVAMLAGWDAHDCDDTRVEKLARLVDAEPEKLSLLATMMGVGHNAQCVALELSPAVQRSRTMRVICEVIIRLAKDRPLLLFSKTCTGLIQPRLNYWISCWNRLNIRKFSFLPLAGQLSHTNSADTRRSGACRSTVWIIGELSR